jgi:hypothetical protein
LVALIVACASTGPVAGADEPTAGQAILVDLGDPAAVATWTTVNDPGGVASARGPVDPEIGRRASGATALGVRAVGDGKTYVLRVETGQPWSYIQRFSTEAGVLRTYDLPVGSFQPVGRFLDPVPSTSPLDPSTISRVSIYILDKQQGPFQLTVSAVTSR